MNKERIGCVIPVVVLIGLFVWTYYRNAEKREARERERTTEAETAQANADKLDEAEELTLKKVAESLRSIVAKHQARYEGEISVKPRGEYRDIYTVDLQDALIMEPPQPIVCVASMLDVARRDRGYETTLVFHHNEELPDGGEFSYSVVLVLTCETDVATSVIREGTGGTSSIELARRVARLERLYGQEAFDESEYIVVATISNVFKPTFATTGRAIGDAESERQVMLELDSGTTFVAHGECIELVRVFELLDTSEQPRKETEVTYE